MRPQGINCCTACQFLKRPSCPPNCRLAPHFSAASHVDFDLVKVGLRIDNVVKRLQECDEPSERRLLAEAMAEMITDDPKYSDEARSFLAEDMLAEAEQLDLSLQMPTINPLQLRRILEAINNDNNTSASTSTSRNNRDDDLPSTSTGRVKAPPQRTRSPAEVVALERIKDRFVEAMGMSINAAILSAEIGFLNLDLKPQDLDDLDVGPSDNQDKDDDDEADQAVESKSDQEKNNREED